MPDSAQTPKISSERNAFSDEDEIKILERRLQLLREGLNPIGGNADVLTSEAREAEEAPEGFSRGETPGSAPPPLPPVLPVQPTADTSFHETKIEELKNYESDKQLKALVEIAFERSLQDAVDIAKRLDNAYLLDELHDVLMDDEQLHKRLIESGKLEEL